MTSDPKLQALKTALEQIEKEYGKGSVMRLGETGVTKNVEVIPTGSLALDLALGIGGLPRGRIIEIFGPEASGKSTIALHVIAQAQKTGGTAALIDTEHAFDPSWAAKIGINLDDLLISQPDTGEQALEIAETLIRSGALDVVVIDSVAALVPRAEIEGEMGEAMMGVQARLMSQALRKLAGAIAKSKTTCIFTNQLRMKIGVMFGNPETTPGGMALKFYSSVRLDTRRIETLKEGENAIGSRIRVKVVKNKLAPPFRSAEMDILFSEGISREGNALDLGVVFGVVTKSGSWFERNEQKMAQGREGARAYLKSNREVLEKVEQEILEKARGGQGVGATAPGSIPSNGQSPTTRD